MDKYVVERIIQLEKLLMDCEKIIAEKKQMISKLSESMKTTALNQNHEKRVSQKEMQKFLKTIEQLESRKEKIKYTYIAYNTILCERHVTKWTQRKMHRNVKREIERAKNQF